MASWERIRTEIKTVDRKVEGLIASTDPELVQGDHLYIVAAYPFHASKLREQKALGIVEDAIERVLGTRYTVVFALRDELPGGGAPPPSMQETAPAWTSATPSQPEPPVTSAMNNGAQPTEAPDWPDETLTPAASDDSGEAAVGDRVLRAKAIFNATEIDADEVDEATGNRQ
jgi:hypothetical protein